MAASCAERAPCRRLPVPCRQGIPPGAQGPVFGARALALAAPRSGAPGRAQEVQLVKLRWNDVANTSGALRGAFGCARTREADCVSPHIIPSDSLRRFCSLAAPSVHSSAPRFERDASRGALWTLKLSVPMRLARPRRAVSRENHPFAHLTANSPGLCTPQAARLRHRPGSGPPRHATVGRSGPRAGAATHSALEGQDQGRPKS